MFKSSQPSRGAFRSTLANVAVAGIVATTAVFGPVGTSPAEAATITETIDTTLSCQTFDDSGRSVTDRKHIPPQKLTVSYPSVVAPGEAFQVKYQPSEATVVEPTGWRARGGWAGRIMFDVTLPSNATITDASVDHSTERDVSGFTYTRNSYHMPPTVFRYDSTPAADTRSDTGSILRMMGEDYPGEPRYSEAYPRTGWDAGYGIGMGTGTGSQLQYGSFLLPQVTVDVTAPDKPGETISFGLRNAGNRESNITANNTQRNFANTFGFVEWKGPATLCRPSDAALASFASTKVVEPHNPDFAFTVSPPTGDERTLTATMPDPLITGTVKFTAKRHGSNQEIDLGAATITDSAAPLKTDLLTDPRGYTISATLVSNDPNVFLETTKTATIAGEDIVAATGTTITADAPAKFTQNKPGTLTFTVAPAGSATGTPEGTVTISYVNAAGETVTAETQVDTDGKAVFSDITFDQIGKVPVSATFLPTDDTEWSDSSTAVDVDVSEAPVEATLTVGNETPLFLNMPGELTATLSDASLTGTIDFIDVTDDPANTTPLGTKDLVNGNATLSNVTFNTSGQRQIKAVFTASNGDKIESDSAPVLVIDPTITGTLPDTGGAGIWSNTLVALAIIALGGAAALANRRRFA